MPTIVPNPWRPSVAIPEPFAPSATPVAPIRPATIVVTQGPQGTPGPAAGFGSASFTEAVTSPADALAANTRQQLQFDADPSQTIDSLKAPFAGHAFWSGNLIVGRAMGDVLSIIVNLLVISQVAGGKIRLDVDVGSSIGPITTTTASLFEAAGTTERVTLTTTVRTLANLLANGGALYLTSSVPVSITRESIVVVPLSAGP